MPETLEFTLDKFTFRVALDRFYSPEGVWAKPEGTWRAHRSLGFPAATQR